VLAFGVARLQDRVHLIVGFQFVLAVLTLGSSALLIPGMGIEGFGVGWLASQGSVAVVLAIILLRPVWRPTPLSTEGAPSSA
jgi:Na+-driven multidrug efflux pump